MKKTIPRFLAVGSDVAEMEKPLSGEVLGDWQALNSGHISYEMLVICARGS